MAVTGLCPITFANYYTRGMYMCAVIIIIPRNYTRKSERGTAKPDEKLRAV